MDATEIAYLVAQIGFPIVMAAGLFWLIAVRLIPQFSASLKDQADKFGDIADKLADAFRAEMKEERGFHREAVEEIKQQIRDINR